MNTYQQNQTCHLRTALARIVERCEAFIDDEANMRTASIEALMGIAEDALAKAPERRQVAAVADAGNWEKSFGSAWPVDVDEPEGAWVIGTIDEDENKYPIIMVEADQYDAPGESEKLANAIIALWSQAFAAPPF